MHGEGTIKKANGEKFKGTFLHGKKEGKAIEIYTDGSRFEGTYKNDEKDGAFILFDKNGNVIQKGTYKHGRVQK